MKSPIALKFTHPCKLIRTKYNYKVENFNKIDLVEVNKLFGMINQHLKLYGDSFFINGKEPIFKNKLFPGGIIEFQSEQTWKLEVRLQGFKKNITTAKLSPIWDILIAKKV